jgi:hypothetical protein
MGKIGLYGLAFLLGTAKFLFAAAIVSTSSLLPFEIAVMTLLGAICSFTLFYKSAGYFMQKAKVKREKAIAEGTYIRKPMFTRINKYMVRTKMSKSGFWLICIFGPLLLSIPLGSIIVAKFYRNKKETYPTAIAALVFWAFILAYLNGVLFSAFK